MSRFVISVKGDKSFRRISAINIQNNSISIEYCDKVEDAIIFPGYLIAEGFRRYINFRLAGLHDDKFFLTIL